MKTHPKRWKIISRPLISHCSNWSTCESLCKTSTIQYSKKINPKPYLQLKINFFRNLLSQIFLLISNKKTYPTGQQKASAVTGSIVGETASHSILGELMTVGSRDNDISFNASISNLGSYILVADANNQPEKKKIG